MPGRGQYWKKGGLIDESVKEEDLSLALQAKVNSAGGHTIQDEGSPLTQRGNLNFIGAGVVASDGIEDTTDVTIAGGGGGLLREDIADPFTDFWFYDEFFYPNPASQLPHYETSVASINATTSAIGGQIDYNTTGVANNVARLNICGAGMQLVDSTKRLIMKCRVQLPNVSVATNGLMVGFFTAQSNGPGGTFPFGVKTNDGLGFLLDGAGNIKTYSDDGITPETTDSGVAQDNSMHVYEIDFDPAGTPTITYKIDGATVKSQTTNLPSFSGAWYCNGQTSDTFAKAVRLDSLFIFNER